MSKLACNKISDLRQLLISASNKGKDGIAFYEKVKGTLIGHSYQKLKDDVFSLGNRLINMGLKGKHIAIVGENSYSWIVSYLAVINGVGVAIPIDKEYQEEQLAELLSKGDADALIFSKTFLDGIQIIKSNNSTVKTNICMQENNLGYVDIGELINEGKKEIEDGDSSYTESEIDINKMSVIMFTSGTTGANKGVMLSQKNLISTIEAASCLFEDFKTTISVLPFHHIYENVCGILIPINLLATVYINDSLKYLAANIKKYHPEGGTMVPLFVESIYKSIQVGIERSHSEKLFNFSVKLNRILLKIGIDVRGLMFKKIHDNFGGKFKTIVCAGAMLNPELIVKFKDIGINVINGYGITECAPLISINAKKNANINSVGQVVPSCEVKIIDKNEDGIGEILVKGKNVMLGYYKDEESTQISFDGEWFKTGDYGYLDKNGDLFITGRKKNLIVLSNGKNVHPEELEGLIINCMPYVQEVVVYVDVNNKGTDVIVAAVYLDRDYIKKNSIEDIKEKIDEDLEKLNDKLPSFKQINHIFIKEEEFVKNTSRKIVRQKFLEEVKAVGR